jgi:hypothetical protein
MRPSAAVLPKFPLLTKLGGQWHVRELSPPGSPQSGVSATVGKSVGLYDCISAAEFERRFEVKELLGVGSFGKVRGALMRRSAARRGRS